MNRHKKKSESLQAWPVVDSDTLAREAINPQLREARYEEEVRQLMIPVNSAGELYKLLHGGPAVAAKMKRDQQARDERRSRTSLSRELVESVTTDLETGDSVKFTDEEWKRFSTRDGTTTTTTTTSSSSSSSSASSSSAPLSLTAVHGSSTMNLNARKHESKAPSEKALGDAELARVRNVIAEKGYFKIKPWQSDFRGSITKTLKDEKKTWTFSQGSAQWAVRIPTEKKAKDKLIEIQKIQKMNGMPPNTGILYQITSRLVSSDAQYPYAAWEFELGHPGGVMVIEQVGLPQRPLQQQQAPTPQKPKKKSPSTKKEVAFDSLQIFSIPHRGML